MKLILTLLIIISTQHLKSQSTYLKDFLYGKINRDKFLIEQKWSGVDSVWGFSYNPYIHNKRIEIVEWVYKTDFKQYLDTTKYYTNYSTTGGNNIPSVEWIEVWQNSEIIRTFAIYYGFESNLITGILDSDLDK